MVMNALRSGATGGALKFILSGFLVLAAGGLVLTDVGGFFRGGVSKTEVAKVGSYKISAQQFNALATRNLQRLGMSAADAYKVGYLREILNGEIRARLLARNAADLGVLVSTEQVAEKLRKILAPMAAPGQAPHDVLVQILATQGMSEQELTDSIRTEVAVTLLGEAVQSGFADVSAPMMLDLAEFESEKRAVEFIEFFDRDFTDIEAPGDESLKKLYEATKDAYARPETRGGQLILIDSAQESLEITEEEVRAAYDSQIDQYQKPEIRVVEQAILADAASGEKIAEAVRSGKSLRDSVREVTGNTTDYLPGKEVEKDQLPDEMKEPVFSAATGDVIGPVKTALGIQLAVVGNIVEAHTQSFESAQKDLRRELETAKMADAKYDLANEIDDLLAAGSTPEDVKQESGAVTVQDLPPINAAGFGPDGKPALEAFGEDAQKIAGALYNLGGEGESSSVFELADGRMAAVFLKELTPRTHRPFEEVRGKIEEQWTQDQKRAGNKLRTLEILSELQSEKSGLADAARTYKGQVQQLSNLSRAQEPKGSLTPQALMVVFEAPENDLFILDLDDGAAIARVTSVSTSRDLSDEQIAGMKPLLLREMETEAYALYVEAQRKAYGAQINDRLLEQLYASRQEDGP